MPTSTTGRSRSARSARVTLAALAPAPGQLLWDVGAGSGSIGIEWLRSEPSARAIAIEERAERAERAARNARTLGVPQLEVRQGRAPGVLAELDAPDAVFIGGGLTEPGLIDRCWEALRPAGRLVANAVTLEGEQVLLTARAGSTGETSRGWPSATRSRSAASAPGAPQLPIVQWSAGKGPA